MKAIVVTVVCGGLLTLFAAGLLSAQSHESNPPEYGDISELKDLRRVYIFASSKPIFDHVSNELRKHKGLEVVEKVTDAEFFLLYVGNQGETGTSLNANQNPFTGEVYGTSHAMDKDVHKNVGIMQVIVPGFQPKTIRILWEVNKSKKFRWGKDPEIKCTQEFIKELEKVDQEK